MPEERIRRFAEKAGLRSPYFVTEWNGWKVYDSTLPASIACGEDASLCHDSFILAGEEELRLTSDAEFQAILQFLPTGEGSCEDACDEDDA